MIGAFWRRLAQNRLLDVAAVGLAICASVKLAHDVPARANQDDFAHYYLSSRLLLERQNPYTIELIPLYARYGFVLPPGIATIRTPNPPLFVSFFTVFARFVPRAGFVCWVAFEIGCLAIILWQTCRLLGDRLTKRGRLFVCAAAIMSAPLYWQLIYSQMGLLLTALVVTAYAWRVQEKHVLASVAVAVAGLLKVFPFVLLPWFLWRGSGSLSKKVMRTAITTGVIGILVLATGWQRWLDFVRYIVPQVPGASLTPFNFGLPGFVANLGLAVSDILPTSDAAHPWITLGACVGLLVIGLCYLVCWWPESDHEAEFCLLCVAVLVGSVRTWGHYLVFLIFPCAVLAMRIAKRPSWPGIALLTITLFFLNDVGTREGPMLDQHRLLKVFVNGFPVYGLLALGTFFLQEVQKRGKCRDAEAGKRESRLELPANLPGETNVR